MGSERFVLSVILKFRLLSITHWAVLNFALCIPIHTKTNLTYWEAETHEQNVLLFIYVSLLSPEAC